MGRPFPVYLMRIRNLLPPLLLAGACNASKIQNQAGQAAEAGHVVAVYPSDGAMFVETDVEVVVILGAKAEGVAPWVVLSSGSDQWMPECDLDQDGLTARCRPVQDLPKDGTVKLQVFTGDDRPLTSSFSTGFPEGSPAWSMMEEATFDELGDSSDSTANTLSGLIRDSDTAAVVLDWEPGLDLETWFLVGAASINGSGNAAMESGLTMAIPIHVESDGYFKSDEAEVFLPIEINGTLVQALVLGARVRGTLEEDRIKDFELSGVLPASALVALTDPLGSASTVALDAVEMDTDWDDDGTNDGASFTLECEPTAINLNPER